MNKQVFAQLVTAIACVTLVAANLGGESSLALPAKMCASTGFIVLALFCQAMRSTYGRIVLAGLCLSLIGDVCLELEADQWFLYGLAAFLLAHVCYATAFAVLGIRWSVTRIVAVPTILASGMALLWLLPHLPPAMLIPVWAYVIVITTMVALAWGATGAGASSLVGVGATLFYLSDLSVAAGQFIQPDFPNYVWGLPLYYAGQCLLAMSTSAGRLTDRLKELQPGKPGMVAGQ